MDIGDWFFWGMVAVSGITALSKALKKKESEQASQESMSKDAGKSDADEWIKNILQETTKGFLEVDDDFIPKNESKPKAAYAENTTVQPTIEYRKRKSEIAEPHANAELYRRSNQSLEGAARPRTSLENTLEVEGNVSHTGLHASKKSSLSDCMYDQPLLNPVNDFTDVDEVRKAVIYGEIMRPKF